MFLLGVSQSHSPSLSCLILLYPHPQLPKRNVSSQFTNIVTYRQLHSSYKLSSVKGCTALRIFVPIRNEMMLRLARDGSPPPSTSINDSKLPVETLFSRAVSAMTAVKVSSNDHQTLFVTKRNLKKDRERNFSDGAIVLPQISTSTAPDSDDSQLLGDTMFSTQSPIVTPVQSRAQSRRQSRASSPARSQCPLEFLDKKMESATFQEKELHSQLTIVLKSREIVSPAPLVVKPSSSLITAASTSSRLWFCPIFYLLTYHLFT